MGLFIVAIFFQVFLLALLNVYAKALIKISNHMTKTWKDNPKFIFDEKLNYWPIYITKYDNAFYKDFFYFLIFNAVLLLLLASPFLINTFYSFEDYMVYQIIYIVLFSLGFISYIFWYFWLRRYFKKQKQIGIENAKLINEELIQTIRDDVNSRDNKQKLRHYKISNFFSLNRAIRDFLNYLKFAKTKEEKLFLIFFFTLEIHKKNRIRINPNTLVQIFDQMFVTAFD